MFKGINTRNVFFLKWSGYLSNIHCLIFHFGGEAEINIKIEGSLAAESSFIILDTLELLVKVCINFQVELCGCKLSSSNKLVFRQPDKLACSFQAPSNNQIPFDLGERET